MILQRPICPQCKDPNTRVVRSISNLSKILISVLLGIFIGDQIPILWRCKTGQHTFKAQGTQPVADRTVAKIVDNP